MHRRCWSIRTDQRRVDHVDIHSELLAQRDDMCIDFPSDPAVHGAVLQGKNIVRILQYAEIVLAGDAVVPEVRGTGCLQLYLSLDVS